MWLRTVLSATLAASVAVADCGDDAMIVFDGSGSMAEMGFNDMAEPRILEARRAVADAIPDIATARRLGLIVYGPGNTDFCAGVDLRFAPQSDAGPRILSEINGLEPSGDTALTKAVEMAAEVLDHRARAGTIVLVTDGKETCGGTPCQLAARLAAEGRDLTIHVIGFKVRGRFFTWRSQGRADPDAETVAACLAEETGGQYVDTETVAELADAFRRTLGCQLMF